MLTSGVSAEALMTLCEDGICKLSSAGLSVCYLVADGASENRSFFKAVSDAEMATSVAEGGHTGCLHTPPP